METMTGVHLLDTHIHTHTSVVFIPHVYVLQLQCRAAARRCHQTHQQQQQEQQQQQQQQQSKKKKKTSTKSNNISQKRKLEHKRQEEPAQHQEEFMKQHFGSFTRGTARRQHPDEVLGEDEQGTVAVSGSDEQEQHQEEQQQMQQRDEQEQQLPHQQNIAENNSPDLLACSGGTCRRCVEYR